MRIRQGNDFIFLWTIVRSGIPEDLGNAKNIKLHFKNFDCIGEVESFQIVDGNIVRVEVAPEWASRLGAYRLILSYEFENHSYSDGDRKCVVDVLAFNIVPKTSEADDLTEVSKTTDIMIGFYGLSAYEVWLKDNPESTKEDYYNWLRQPATDAVSLIDDKIEHLDEVIDSSTANEAERVSAETLRLQSENLRISAETERKANEVERLANEASRASDELIREANESSRKQDEATRKTNENERETAELTRQSSESERNEAEGSRVDAEIIREQQEQARQANTATAITNAENAIDDVNAAKDDYYDVVKPDIIAQGEYATAQGDYAKAQGEAVDGRVTALEDKVDKNIGWYGVEWSTAITSPSMTRIGSMNLHRELPVQNKMKGVLLNNDGTVNKYLDENDWTSEVRDGTQGQVMVEMPEFYYKFEADGNIRRMLISDYALTGFEKMPKMYISAYEASLNGSNLSSEAGVMAKTSYSRTNFRSSARNRGDGWEMYFYNAHKSMLMLYFVEYANRNSQLNFNAQLTESGFKQGGLGNGVTTVIGGEWSSYNGYNPFVECGFTDTLGNNTGVVTMDVPFGSVPTVDVPRYRGIENPFGHIWKNCDGINIDIKTDEDGGTSTCYICDDPAMFSDSSYEGYTNVGLLPRSDGYITEMLLGEFMPANRGGGSTTYWADYFYTSVTSSSLRTVLWGGRANHGATAGLGCSDTHGSPSDTSADFGSRVCFFKKRNS